MIIDIDIDIRLWTEMNTRVAAVLIHCGQAKVSLAAPVLRRDSWHLVILWNLEHLQISGKLENMNIA